MLAQAMIAQGLDHPVLGRRPLPAGGDHSPELAAQSLELRDFGVDGVEPLLGQSITGADCVAFTYLG
jgi:hypothetical protein